MQINIQLNHSKIVGNIASKHKSRDYLFGKLEKESLFFLFVFHESSRYFCMNKFFEKIVIVGNEIAQIDNR